MNLNIILKPTLFLVKQLLKLLRNEDEVIQNDYKKFTHIKEIKLNNHYGHITKIFRTIPYETYLLKTENNELICADKHLVFINDKDFVHVDSLKKDDLVKVLNGYEKVIEVKKLNIKTSMYCVEVENGDNKYYTNNILSHNTTTAAAYILWYAMFFPNKNILIASNVASGAKEVIERIKTMYEYLPLWLKDKVVEYNVHTIKFANKTKIMASATTENTGRGFSINLLYCLGGENTVTVKDKETGEIKNISLRELYNSI